MGSIANMIIFCICAVIGILVHEFGHALMAQRYGLNPEIMLSGFGGVTKQSRSTGPKQEFLITLMGPLTNLALGGIVFGLYYGLNALGLMSAVVAVPYLMTFGYFLFLINIFWGIFNLLPAKPMDGFKVLGYGVHKFVRPGIAEKIMTVISLIFVIGILTWSILTQNTFMIFMSVFFVLANLDGLRKLFLRESSGQPKMLGIQAEALYEKGLMASRQHDWKDLEIIGYQMKKAAEGKEQIGRAYELLTIACTNLGKYDEALKYSKHAKQSDPVKKAVKRCEHEVNHIIGGEF